MAIKYKEPYRQKSSIVHQAFQLAKKGATEKEIVRLVNSMKGDSARILKKLRRGYGGKFLWDVEEARGRIRVLNIRPAAKV